ncbi:unnamed protein product [Calypogeia fissa]
MDHIPVVKQERVVWEGRVIREIAGSDKPWSPRSPRQVEQERVATPPQEPLGAEAVEHLLSDTMVEPEQQEDAKGLTRGNTAEAPRPVEGDNQEEVIIIDASEDKAPEDNASEGNAPVTNVEESEMLITNIPRDIVALAQQVEHEQFWRDMGLYDFVHLQWNTTIGTQEECIEFIKHTTPVATLVSDEVINITEDNLASLFHLGVGETKDIASRARSWQSQKFPTPKEKNG